MDRIIVMPFMAWEYRPSPQALATDRSADSDNTQDRCVKGLVSFDKAVVGFERRL